MVFGGLLMKMSFFFFKEHKEFAPVVSYYLQRNLPVFRMNLSPMTSRKVWRKSLTKTSKELQKKYIGLAIQIITLSIISAIKQCKENCMETVKCELYSSQGPAVYLANWSFRALLMYLFQLPANPRLI